MKTQVVKLDHRDFLTVAASTTQTVNILKDSTAATHTILVFDATIYGAENWVGGTVTIAMGTTTDTDGFNTAFALAGKVVSESSGALLRWDNSLTMPGQGTNTGTATSELSLIGDTSTTNQASAIMTDFETLRQTIVSIGNKLDGTATHKAASLMPYEQNIGTGGAPIVATLTNTANWSAMTAGRAYAILTYMDFAELK